MCRFSCLLYGQNELDEGAGGLAHLLSIAEHGVRQGGDDNVVVMTQVRKCGRKSGCQVSGAKSRKQASGALGRLVLPKRTTSYTSLCSSRYCMYYSSLASIARPESELILAPFSSGSGGTGVCSDVIGGNHESGGIGVTKYFPVSYTHLRAHETDS